MSRLAINLLIICTIVQSLQLIRPGAEWLLNNNNLTWLDKNQIRPTAAEIQSGIDQCQAKQDQLQNDTYNINLSSNTAVQKLPALIDALKQKGVL